MLAKFMRQEGTQLSLLFKFKTRLFSVDNIGERPSYNHLVFPFGTVSSVGLALWQSLTPPHKVADIGSRAQPVKNSPYMAKHLGHP
jgi:hypothetical protein